MKKILRLLSFVMALVLLCTSYITVGAVATDKLFISKVSPASPAGFSIFRCSLSNKWLIGSSR